MIMLERNTVNEWIFHSDKHYNDPFNEIEMDVLFTNSDGTTQKIPAFWSGDDIWKVRYASSITGNHTYETVCSDSGNRSLHSLKGEFSVMDYVGDNILLRHGPLRVAESRRYLEHIDGTPFFWLADTWWMGLCKRFKWPEDFHLLTEDRCNKGFNVVQIVSGPLPGFITSLETSVMNDEVERYLSDERTANEGGWPWTKGWSSINPVFFDEADKRIMYLVESGIVPCVVGSWGSYIDVLGSERLKKHWRYIIARWGALPTVWCIAGEALQQLSDSAPERGERRRQWTEVTRYVRETDSFHHPITIHPSVSEDGCSAKKMVDDPELLDFDMLQIGHWFETTKHLNHTVLNKSRNSIPVMPVINGEVSYEGIFGGNWQEVQRFFFWTSVLSGSAGHTYGSLAIHCLQTRNCKHVHDYFFYVMEQACWEEDYQLPGARQMGVGKGLMERYDWSEFKPIPIDRIKEWEAGGGHPFCSGIPGRLWIMYLPYDLKYLGLEDKRVLVGELGRRYKCRAFFFSPRTGKSFHEKVIETESGHYARVESSEFEETDDDGYFRISYKITGEDWVFVIEVMNSLENETAHS